MVKREKKLYGNLAVVLFSIAAVLVLIISIYTTVLVNTFSRYLRSSIEGRILLISRVASELVTEEELEELKTPEDMEKPLYQAIKERLVGFSENHDVLFVYYYRINSEGRLQPIIDNDFSENSYTLLTKPLEMEEAIIVALNTGKAVVTGLGDYSVGFEGLISAFTPLCNSKGNIIGIAGVDISDEEVIQTKNKTIILSMLLIISIIFVIGSGFLSFFIYGRKEAAFIRQFKQQELMAKLAKSLMAAPDTAVLINDALRITGEFLNVTRIAVSIAEKNSPVCHGAYVWSVNRDILDSAGMEKFNSIIAENFPLEQPADGNIPIIYSGDVQKDCRYAALMPAGVTAFIVAPLYIDNTFWALMSIEHCGTPRMWTKSDRQLAAAVSSVIAGAAIRDLRARERNAALEEAKRASQAKSDFFANMSHEMRTPMNAIIGMTAIAKASENLERKDYCLDKIEDASTHLLGVINDMLDMAKIEADKFELSFDDFNFEKMLQKVVNVIGFQVEEKKQIFSVHIDRRIPGALYGDDQRLAQVITNLLSNAVKFTPEAGVITLDAGLESAAEGFCEIRISITDSGIGISPEQQSRLFSSFQQADSGTSRKFGGTGLGLAISKRIVEMMNGKIWVVSEQGKGSSFIFTVQVEKSGTITEHLCDPGIPGDNLRLLAVDRAEDIRRYFGELSERFHFSCDTARDGTEALDNIKKNGPYDIYFVDRNAPGMDGIELIRKIKEHTPGNAAVLMVSAQEWMLIEEEAKKAGVDMCISKPLFPSAIADCIIVCTGSDNQTAAGNGEKEAAEDFSGFRILLAEDVEINREIVQALLEPTNLEIVCAENGAETVRLYAAEHEKYDMIFMDVQMPEMDGYEATRRIRAFEAARGSVKPSAVSPGSRVNAPARVPIIAMTANVFREDIEKCLEAGMDAHIGKPLHLKEVLATLRRCLLMDSPHSMKGGVGPENPEDLP